MCQRKRRLAWSQFAWNCFCLDLHLGTQIPAMIDFEHVPGVVQLVKAAFALYSTWTSRDREGGLETECRVPSLVPGMGHSSNAVRPAPGCSSLRQSWRARRCSVVVAVVSIRKVARDVVHTHPGARSGVHGRTGSKSRSSEASRAGYIMYRAEVETQTGSEIVRQRCCLECFAACLLFPSYGLAPLAATARNSRKRANG